MSAIVDLVGPPPSSSDFDRDRDARWAANTHNRVADSYRALADYAGGGRFDGAATAEVVGSIPLCSACPQRMPTERTHGAGWRDRAERWRDQHLAHTSALYEYLREEIGVANPTKGEILLAFATYIGAAALGGAGSESDMSTQDLQNQANHQANQAGGGAFDQLLDLAEDAVDAATQIDDALGGAVSNALGGFGFGGSSPEPTAPGASAGPRWSPFSSKDPIGGSGSPTTSDASGDLGGTVKVGFGLLALGALGKLFKVF